ncbi:MAG: hypothetical protein QOI38_2948, partial [Sphingomonadales bacterium]|nr:hypothetical protein [Sphingomonadales bacterium]
MRGPGEPPTGEDSEPVPEAGGEADSKVLERLHLFNMERGFRAEAEDGAPANAGLALLAGAALRVADAYGEGARMLAGTTAERLMAAAVPPADGGGAPGAAAGAIPAAAAGAPVWKSIGPTRMDNGQTYDPNTRVPVSGRVSSVAVDPTNSNHILCGSAAGGVWRTLDGGATWSPRTDFAPTLTIGAITFDPGDPATVYAGTGEGNFYASLGQGVLRSTDGGASFSLLPDRSFVGQGFYDLIVDPGNRQRLLAATTHGLWLSTDGGAHWQRRRTSKTWSLSIAGQGGPGAEILAGCEDGLFRSTDGLSWAAVALPGGAPSYKRMAVDHPRTDPSVAYVFAAANEQRHLWRRAAGAWTRSAPPSDTSAKQDWYNWFLAAAPDRADQIYVGEIEVRRGDLGAAGWAWTRISNKPGQAIHPDQHAVAVSAADPSLLLVGNDGGLFRSPDRGQTWQPLNNGLAITEIEYIAQDHGSARWLVGGTQDNGSIRYQGSTVWDHIADGDGGDCGVDRSNPATVFHTYYGMGMERSTRRGDFGSFARIGPTVPDAYDALFYPPMEVNGATVAQAGTSIFLSRNSGALWRELPLTGGPATALHLSTPDLAFAGTKTGQLFKIRWTGSAWGAPQPLTAPRPGAWISDLHASADGNRIWATSTIMNGGRVFLSTDGGATWRDRTAGLPNLPINTVEVDAADANRIWVAADIGVFQSRDAGLSWSVLGVGLPNVLVADLLFHPHARLLRAGTRNRGVWEIPVDGEMAEPLCGVQFNATVAANRTQVWTTRDWPATWHVVWTAMPTTVGPGAPQLSIAARPERAGHEHVAYWISVTN